MRAAFFCMDVSRSFSSSNSRVMRSSAQKARITRAPTRLPRVDFSTSPSLLCTRRNIGMVTSVMANTTASSSGIATTKMSAQRTSIVNARIIAPKTINGERRSRRSVMLMPVCTWERSLVMRVSVLEMPTVSSSAWQKRCTFRNISCRSSVATPTAAFAEKYCAVAALTKPTMQNSTSSPHIARMYGLSAFLMPTSTRFLTTSGTSSSKVASSILKSGASTASFLNFARYPKTRFMPKSPC